MKRKDLDSVERAPSCCERRSVLRGLGAAGLLLLGRCSTSGAKPPEGVDRGFVAEDGGFVAADTGAALVDTSFVGSDGGLPSIDLVAPTVVQTATFALG
jgi:hypothetical protein